MKNSSLLLSLGVVLLIQSNVYAQGSNNPGTTAGKLLQKAVLDKNPKAALTFAIPSTNDLVMVTLDPGWNMVQQVPKTNGGSFVYAPPGENKYYESIIASAYFGLQNKTDPSGFTMMMKERQQIALDKGKIDWKMVDNHNPNDVIFEYTIKNAPGFTDQYEMQRVTKGLDGIYTFIYHTRQVPCDATKKSHMASILKGITIQKTADYINKSKNAK